MKEKDLIYLLSCLDFEPDTLIVKIPNMPMTLINTKEAMDAVMHSTYFINGINIARAAMKRFVIKRTNYDAWVLEIEIEN